MAINCLLIELLAIGNIKCLVRSGMTEEGLLRQRFTAEALGTCSQAPGA